MNYQYWYGAPWCRGLRRTNLDTNKVERWLFFWWLPSWFDWMSVDSNSLMISEEDARLWKPRAFKDCPKEPDEPIGGVMFTSAQWAEIMKAGVFPEGMGECVRPISSESTSKAQTPEPPTP